MKKKIFPLLITVLIVTLINLGMNLYLVFNNLASSLKNRPVVISKDYDKGQSVEKALATGKPMVFWFYTDWCGYCQKFAPTYKKLSKDKLIKKNVAMAYINAEDSKNEKYVKEYNVEGFPTVYLVKGGKKELINPIELFGYNAFETLRDKILNFAK